MRLLLDTNILKRLCHPSTHRDVQSWFERALQYASVTPDSGVFVSAVAEYELRRGYHWKLDKHDDERKSLARLGDFCSLLGVQPVTNQVFLDAALLWAQARRGGYSTAAEDRVDWDVVLAAHGRELRAVVVTSNSKHFSRYGIEARDWDQVQVPLT